MTKETFIQKAMLALLANPRVTHAGNFLSPGHHQDIHNAARTLAAKKDMFFDSMCPPTLKTGSPYPDLKETKMQK